MNKRKYVGRWYVKSDTVYFVNAYRSPWIDEEYSFDYPMLTLFESSFTTKAKVNIENIWNRKYRIVVKKKNDLYHVTHYTYYLSNNDSKTQFVEDKCEFTFSIEKGLVNIKYTEAELSEIIPWAFTKN
ncbi:MAG: hypothetical protein PSN34_04815 [Urechidicola sp.]|nr:hypothetical protein [Urechidicola sp.]